MYTATNERYLDRVAKAGRLAASRGDAGKRMPADKAAKKIYKKCISGKKATYVIGVKYKLFRLAQRLTSDTGFLALTSFFAS